MERAESVGQSSMEDDYEGGASAGLNSLVVRMSAARLASFTLRRPGEKKAGEVMLTLDEEGIFEEALAQARHRGAVFAILGLPEDITPRANLGRGGAAGAWSAFLSSLANVQANRYFPFQRVLVVGEVRCADLQGLSRVKTDTETLRQLSAELDLRVAAVVAALAKQRLVIVVIGGGHGGCYGIIKGLAAGLDVTQAFNMAVINCDPHADYRALEGRHSGNGFSYAASEGWLRHYAVLAPHESYNSEEMIARLQAEGHSFGPTFEDIYLRGRYSWEQCVDMAVDEAKAKVGTAGVTGLECDMDCLAYMPSSAMLPYGLSLRELAYFLRRANAELFVPYLHLPEAAPELWPCEGERIVGRSLAWLALGFMKTHRLAQ